MSYTYIPLVDNNCNFIGYAEKLYAHQSCLLHLAFSLMVYRTVNKRVQVLLQKRATSKYHCPGLWANTCCSHPKSLESIIADVQRRTNEELGLNLEKSSIKLLDRFIYKENVGNQLTEYEYDHVFIAPFPKGAEILLNPNEAEQINWCDFNDLEQRALESSSAPWLKYVVAVLKHNKSAFR